MTPKGFGPLMRMIADRIDALLADKGHAIDTVREILARKTMEAVIPARRNRRNPATEARAEQGAVDYRAQVERLNEALADPKSRLEAIPALRELIDRIVVMPKPSGRGMRLEVEGRLAAIIDLATGKTALEERLLVMERVKGIEPSS